MRINILASAVADMYAGRLFYEEQAEGAGAYFFDSLFSDIDSLASMPASIPGSTATTACYPSDFLALSTTPLRGTKRSCGECST